MRENRPYGSEGGESGSTGLPYPYRATGGYDCAVAIRCQAVDSGARKASTVWRQVATGDP